MSSNRQSPYFNHCNHVFWVKESNWNLLINSLLWHLVMGQLNASTNCINNRGNANECVLKKVLPDSWIFFQTLDFHGLIKEKVYHPIC